MVKKSATPEGGDETAELEHLKDLAVNADAEIRAHQPIRDEAFGDLKSRSDAETRLKTAATATPEAFDLLTTAGQLHGELYAKSHVASAKKQKSESKKHSPAETTWLESLAYCAIVASKSIEDFDVDGTEIADEQLSRLAESIVIIRESARGAARSTFEDTHIKEKKMPEGLATPKTAEETAQQESSRKFQRAGMAIGAGVVTLIAVRSGVPVAAPFMLSGGAAFGLERHYAKSDFDHEADVRQGEKTRKDIRKHNKIVEEIDKLQKNTPRDAIVPSTQKSIITLRRSIGEGMSIWDAVVKEVSKDLIDGNKELASPKIKDEKRDTDENPDFKAFLSQRKTAILMTILLGLGGSGSGAVAGSVFSGGEGQPNNPAEEVEDTHVVDAEDSELPTYTNPNDACEGEGAAIGETVIYINRNDGAETSVQC